MALSDVIGNWDQVLQREFDSDYMRKLASWLQQVRQVKTVYPDSEDVFRALKLCPYGQVKVVIIGQEPYYQGNADGLAFSYKDGLRQGNGKQALDVILDEIEHDCYEGFNPSRDYQLDYLAKQGVLLLNSVLTVFRNQVGSHKNIGWEKLTTKIIQSQIEEKSPKVFMIWGKDAKEIWSQAIANTEENYGWSLYAEHLVLEAYHPAYDLHKRDQFGEITLRYPQAFTGCKHFSQANAYLIETGVGPIDWFSPYEPFNNVRLTDNAPF